MSGEPTFAFLGCGNMGMAVLRGALASGALRADTTLVVEASAERRAQAQALGVRTSAGAAGAAGCTQFLLAVKPQHFEAVASELPAAPPLGDGSRLAISLMAGWSSESISSRLGDARVVRTMPNLPAQVGRGVTAIAASILATPDDVALVERLFGGVGRTVRVREDQLDAVTAVSGSGPAYLFLLAEAEVAAAQALGFDAQTARALVTGTIEGAAAMLAASAESPAALRAQVTSKGGTTEAALAVFERDGFMPMVQRALEAARDRGAALGR